MATLSPVAVPLSMLVVFVSAKLLGELFERLGQPGIVGELLAGVLIGPGVLGWMAPNDTLNILSQLGAMFLLFRVGLEVKSSELLRVGRTALLVATAGVLAPFTLGWLISALWGEPHIEAIFTGAAMVATSVGITARVLSAQGLLQQRASQIILAAAVIDDVLGLIVLALVSGLAKGSVSYLDVALTATIAIAFTGFVAFWGTRTVGRIAPLVRGRLKTAEAEFTLALCLLFALSLVAVYAGVAAIIGAFLAGMALSETVEQRVHDLTGGVTELLVPFFLVSIGLHFDVAAFATPSILLLAFLILIAAIVSKLVRLRPRRHPPGPCRRAPRGSRHDAPRRGRHGGGANRPGHGGHVGGTSTPSLSSCPLPPPWPRRHCLPGPGAVWAGREPGTRCCAWGKITGL